MAYYSPEGFDIRDGDHDHALTAGWRTPRQAAKLTLALKDAPEFVVGLPTPQNDELRLTTDKPQPEVFTAYLRRDKVLVYTPDMLEEQR